MYAYVRMNVGHAMVLQVGRWTQAKRLKLTQSIAAGQCANKTQRLQIKAETKADMCVHT